VCCSSVQPQKAVRSTCGRSTSVFACSSFVGIRSSSPQLSSHSPGVAPALLRRGVQPPGNPRVPRGFESSRHALEAHARESGTAPPLSTTARGGGATPPLTVTSPFRFRRTRPLKECGVWCGLRSSTRVTTSRGPSPGLCCPPFAGRVDSAGRTQAEKHCRGREYSAPPNGDEVHDDDEDWNAGRQTSVNISVGRHPLDHRDVPPGCVSQAGNSRRGLGVAHRILRSAAGMDGSGQKGPTRMKVRLPRNRVRLNPRADPDPHQASALVAGSSG
jgi:hypothetical protein